MKKISVALIISLAFTAGCFRPGIKGDGVMKTETRPVTEFSKITVGGRYEIEWSKGQPALSISADQNLLPLIKITAAGNELRVDSAEKLAPSQPIKLVLSSGGLGNVQ